MEPVVVSSDLSEKDIGAVETSGGKLFPVMETRSTTADDQHEETAATVKVYSATKLHPTNHPRNRPNAAEA